MTAKTKSARLRRLLSHGFFAPELPPCFVSEDLAKFRKSILDGVFALPPAQQRPAFHRYVTEPSWFYFPRYGKADRRHGVPNPISYILLASVIADHYVELRRRARASGISASPPVFDWSGARALMRPSVDLRDDFRVDLSSRREEFASADIRAFFHSIYTHSIPWAIYGKSWAKTNRQITHYGNLIDLLCRNCQDGQTIGLPVGPDTSRLLAEVIASAMDEELRSRLPITARDASRYIDDYTISSAKGQSGETLIAALRQSAAHFELELNSDKSAIVPTSHRHYTGWKQAVRSYIPSGGTEYWRVQQFLFEVGRICNDLPDVNVEKYALQNARSALIAATDWHKIQSNLINIYRRNPSLISFLVEILILRQVEKADVDLENLRDFVQNRLPVLARANRSGELIWLLFLIVRLNIVISVSSISVLQEMENSMIALLVLVARSRQLIAGAAVDTQIWDRSCSSSGLRSPMWLYAYESVGAGYNTAMNPQFIIDDEYFALLHAKKVRFLDINAGFVSMASTLRNLRGGNDRMRLVREDFAEDFSLDVEEFDDDEFEDDAAHDIY